MKNEFAKNRNKIILKGLLSLTAFMFFAPMASAVRTYRHPTVAWREYIPAVGGGVTIQTVNLDPGDCVGAGPFSPTTLLRDCPGAGAPSTRHYTGDTHPLTLESWLVITNISDIEQEVRLNVKGGSVPFLLDGLLGGAVANIDLLVGCLSGSTAILSTTSGNIMPGTARIPGAATWLTIPPQSAEVCFVFPAYKAPAAYVGHDNVGITQLTATGTYDFWIEIKQDRGAVSGTLYYNITPPRSMVLPKNVNSSFPRQTYLLNGGNPF